MYYIIYIFIFLLLPYAFLNKRTICVCHVNGQNVVSYKWIGILSFAFILTVFLRGITYDTGADWIAYYEYLHGLSNGYETVWGEHTEFMYRMLCKLLVALKLPVFVFFCICMALNYYSVIKFSKLFYYCVPFALLMWYPFMFSMSCNIYRQFIAMAFFLISCFYLLNKKIYLFLLYICVAVLFHTSVIVIIPFVLVAWYLDKHRIDINKNIIMFLIIVSHILGYSSLLIIDEISGVLSMIFSMGNGNTYEFSSASLIENQYGASFIWFMLPVHLYWIILADRIKRFVANFRFVYYLSCIYFVLYPISHEEFLMRMCLYIELFTPFMLGAIFFMRKRMFNRITNICYIISLIPVWVLFLYHFFSGFDEQYITVFDKNIWY